MLTEAALDKIGRAKERLFGGEGEDSALSLAIRAWDEEAALRELGAVTEKKELDRRGKYGETALMLAADRGMEKLVAELLRRGADPNRRAREGKTALLEAAGSDRPEAGMACARLLLEAGADPNIGLRGELGMSPLWVAAKRGNAELVAARIEAGAKLDRLGPAEQTPLMAAAGARAEKAVEELIKGGADVGKRGRLGARALHWAAMEGSERATEALLRAGADPRAKDEKGKEPADWALIGRDGQGCARIIGAWAERGDLEGMGLEEGAKGPGRGKGL